MDESFCPVRAMLGAFLTGAHFPIPDLLICSVGATCDDFSAIAQRLEGWGIPSNGGRSLGGGFPNRGKRSVSLPGGLTAPQVQVELVRAEFERLRVSLERLSGQALDDDALAAGIRVANQVRTRLPRTP